MQYFNTENLNSFYEDVFQLILQTALAQENISEDGKIACTDDEIKNKITHNLQKLFDKHAGCLPNSLNRDDIKEQCVKSVRRIIAQLDASEEIKSLANYGIMQYMDDFSFNVQQAYNNQERQDTIPFNTLQEYFNAANAEGATTQIKQNYRLACFRKLASYGSIQSLRTIYYSDPERETLYNLITDLTTKHQIIAHKDIVDDVTGKINTLYSLIREFNDKNTAEGCIDEIKHFRNEWNKYIDNNVKKPVLFSPRMMHFDSPKFKITNYTDTTNESNAIQTTSTHFDCVFDEKCASLNNLFREGQRYTTNPLTLLPFYDKAIEIILRKNNIKFAQNLEHYPDWIMLEILKECLNKVKTKPISVRGSRVQAEITIEDILLKDYILVLTGMLFDKSPEKRMLYYANAFYEFTNNGYFYDNFSGSVSEYNQQLNKVAKCAYVSSLYESQNKITLILSNVKKLLNEAEDLKSNVRTLEIDDIRNDIQEYRHGDGIENRNIRILGIDKIIEQLSTSKVNLEALQKDNPYKDQKIPNLHYNDVLEYYNTLNQTSPINIEKIVPNNETLGRVIRNDNGDPLIPVLPLSQLPTDKEKQFSGVLNVGGCQLYPILAGGLNSILKENSRNHDDVQSDININLFFCSYRKQIFGQNGLFVQYIKSLDIGFQLKDVDMDAHADSDLASHVASLAIKSDKYEIITKEIAKHSHCVAVKAENFIDFMLGLEGKGNPAITLGALKDKLKIGLENLKEKSNNRENNKQKEYEKQKKIAEANKAIKSFNNNALAFNIPSILFDEQLMKLTFNKEKNYTNTFPDVMNLNTGSVNNTLLTNIENNKEKEREEAKLKLKDLVLWAQSNANKMVPDELPNNLYKFINNFKITIKNGCLIFHDLDENQEVLDDIKLLLGSEVKLYQDSENKTAKTLSQEDSKKLFDILNIQTKTTHNNKENQEEKINNLKKLQTNNKNEQEKKTDNLKELKTNNKNKQNKTIDNFKDNFKDNKINMNMNNLKNTNNTNLNNEHVRNKDLIKDKEIIKEMSNILSKAIQQTQKTILLKTIDNVKKQDNLDNKGFKEKLIKDENFMTQLLEYKYFIKQLLEDRNFIKHVISFAQENDGLGNAKLDKWAGYIEKSKKEENHRNYAENKYFVIAQELSYQYKIAATKHKKVEQRLCSIPKQCIDGIVDEMNLKSQIDSKSRIN